MRRAVAISVLLTAISAIAFAQKQPLTQYSPIMVAKVDLSNQTAAIPTTTLFTPAQTGVYRISAYMTMVAAGSSTTGWSIFANYTDDAGAQTLGCSVSSEPVPGSVGFCTLLVHAIAGTPVAYSTNTYGQGDSYGTYDLFLRAERLY